MDQFNLFDSVEFDPAENEVSVSSVPEVNAEGFIPADQLIPEQWEAWQYTDKDLCLNNDVYRIHAVLAILPGNRLYVKEWMLYPFMYQLSSPKAVLRMYYEIRAKIVEREKHNSERKETRKLDTLPPLENMWKYADDEYSCYQYALTRLYGYNCQRRHQEGEAEIA